MVTMKGFTSSLPILFLLTLPHNGQSEPKASDYVPGKLQMMMLPTTSGTLKKPDFTKNGGQLKNAHAKCGEVTVSSDELDLPYKGQNFEMHLDCRPHPMRVIMRDPKTNDPNGAAIGSAAKMDVNLGTCQGFQKCTDFANLETVNHGGVAENVLNGLDTLLAKALNKPAAEDNICEGDPINMLFANEVGCTAPNLPAFTTAATDYYMFPRWQTNDDGYFELLRPFMYNGLGQKKEKPFDRTNAFIDFQKNNDMAPTHEWKSCQASCDKGNIIKMNMKPGSWKTTLYLSAKTNGLKVCIGAEGYDDDTGSIKCKPKFEMYILPKNGVVIWPKTGRASLLEMRSTGLTEHEKIAIEFGFGYGTTSSGQLAGEFYVGNMYREMVVSDSDGWDPNLASKVAFFFEHDGDLINNGGIYAPYMESAKTYIDKKFSQTVQNLPLKNKQQGQAVAAGGENINVVQETIEPVIPTTTPSPKRLSSNAQAGVLLQSSDNSNDAIYMNGKWWAWALYIGFIIGSIVGAVIIGLIFYGLRRTVYGFWYRGMYKRYGCDASGTTGGITGVGFGNTTTGAITVGGTTGGGTTAGTTAGTTGSTTRTGGTTGSMTSTGGASTIAM